MKVRAASGQDFTAICELIEKYAGQGLLLPRATADVRAHLDRFLVLTEPTSSLPRAKECLLGCVSLEPYGADLAEVRSLAVIPEAQGRGAGAKLLDAALAEAKSSGIARIFAVTHAPGLFQRLGFERTTRQALPEKIERDCHACPHASDCELISLVAVTCPDRVVLPVLNLPWKVATAV